VSCCFPSLVIAQLSERVGALGYCKVFLILSIMQILSISCFFADEALLAELFLTFFQAMNCKDKEGNVATTSQFGNIAGISTGLPWIMTKISPKADDYEEQAFQAGTLFPCPTKYTGGVDWPTSTTPDKDKITDQINVSVDVAIAFTIAFAVLQILSGILFVIFVMNMRSKLRAQGKATGNAALDCLLGCCCCCCFLNQSLRESGITGKSYSLTATDGELGAPGGATYTKAASGVEMQPGASSV